MPKINNETMWGNIIVALITAIASISGTYIATRNDTQSDMQESNKSEKANISGIVYSDSNLTHPINGIEIYLVDNDNLLSTDNEGKFIFDDFELKSWLIIARDPNSVEMTSYRYQLDKRKDASVIKMPKGYIKYQIDKNK
jgi:hypothetical protein